MEEVDAQKLDDEQEDEMVRKWNPSRIPFLAELVKMTQPDRVRGWMNQSSALAASIKSICSASSVGNAKEINICPPFDSIHHILPHYQH